MEGIWQNYGIGDGTGWGGIILDEEGIKGVFCKELIGESYDDCTGYRDQKGKFIFIEPRSLRKILYSIHSSGIEILIHRNVTDIYANSVPVTNIVIIK